MKKILLHLSNENEYRSFIRSLVKNAKDNLNLIGNVVHDVLFDTHYKLKPDVVILPTNEYTQEFHDYITEYYNSTKIVLFTNNVVVNTNIINFWNSTNITIVSKKEWYTEQQPKNLISYDSLYDDEIYKNLQKQRNNKVAVYLSSDDDNNKQLLEGILYPHTKIPLVMFNSPTFKHPQNVGLLTSEDSCKILNTYQALIDVDNRFSLEAAACGIDNLSTNGNISDNISSKILKPNVIDISNRSYSHFIQTTFLPTL